MADDKARAEKLAAARKKAQEKAAKAKAKKGKAAPAKEDESAPAAAAAAAATETPDEPKDEAPSSPPPQEAADAPAEPETGATEENAIAADDAAEAAAITSPEPIETSSPAPISSDTPSESTAALEAKLAELDKECAEAKSARDEAQLMADALEKKVVSLEMLHKEDEGQIRRLESDLAEAQSENVELKKKVQKAEAEALRLSKKEAQDGGGTDNDHLDELEDEERQKLEKKIRELEAENTDLKRGIWQEKRKELQPGMDEAPGGQFTTVDLGSGGAPGAAHRKHQGSFGDFLTSGLNALTGAGGHQQGYGHGHGHGHGHEHDDDGFLEDDDDFDEEAFRKAQEDAAKARIERIKDIKRGLKNWEGWRLDLVEGRRGGGEGIGEIFEV